MTQPDWADKQVEKVEVPAWGPGPYIQPDEAAKLLRAEYQRALRAVRKVSASIRDDNGSMRQDSMDVDQYDAYEEACADILAALRKGRE